MLFRIVINLIQLFSALTGSYFLRKTNYRVSQLTRYFVWFLWLTAFVELVFGWIPALVQEVAFLEHLRSTFLANNFWAYNVYFIISFLFYIFYFKNNINSKKIRSLLSFLMVGYLIASVSSLVFTDTFFLNISQVTYFLGSILIFISVMLYFFEVLQSDKILSFHKELPFYVAVGTMTLHLVATPLFIYTEFYSLQNKDYIEVRWIILSSANIFMYTCYIIGFIVCSRKNKSY